MLVHVLRDCDENSKRGVSFVTVAGGGWFID